MLGAAYLLSADRVASFAAVVAESSPKNEM